MRPNRIVRRQTIKTAVLCAVKQMPNEGVHYAHNTASKLETTP
jgi:hypothetical protein